MPRGTLFDLKRSYAEALLSGGAALVRLRHKMLRSRGWSAIRLLWDLALAMDLTGENSTSTFTCAATARTCWGYVGDPAAGNPPRLITGIPADVQAIVGDRWNGTKFLTTDTSGATLNPYTSKSTPSGTVKVFTSFPTYAVSTAYGAGVQVAILTTAGNRVYMTSSGGTSDAAAVVIADSDIGGAVVADNDINWAVVGYATGLAVQLEAASENESSHSRELDNAAWTTAQVGTPSPTADEIGVDGSANSAYTLTDNDAGDTEAIRHNNMVVPDDGNTHIHYVFVKKDSDTSRFPAVILRFGGGSALLGRAQINTVTGATVEVSSGKLSGHGSIRMGDWWLFWQTIGNDSSGNTSISQYLIPADGSVFGTTAVAATGSAIFDQSDLILNQSFIGSSIITAATSLARAATLLLDTTAGRISAASWGLKWIGTPIGAGQSNTIFGTYVDADNYTAIITTATEVILRERVGGADTDTTETYTHLAGVAMEVHAKHDGVKSYIKAFSVGDAEPAWESTNYTTDSQIAATFENCSDGNNADHFSAFDTSMQLSINPADLGL